MNCLNERFNLAGTMYPNSLYKSNIIRYIGYD